MDNQIKSTSVAIVGGGLAGLTAACYLARAGTDVTVFEKGADLGGRAATQIREDFRFNRGVHAIYTGGQMSQVLQELGVDVKGGNPKAVSVLSQGKLFPPPSDPDNQTRGSLLNMADRHELTKVFSSIQGLDHTQLGHVSALEWLKQNIRRPRVFQYIAASARTLDYTSALDLVSADVFILRTQRFLQYPLIYVDDGWQSIVAGLHRKAEEAGAHIVTGARVEMLDYQSGHVQALRLASGDTLSAQAVILAARPQDALKLLDQGQYAPLRKIVDGLVPAQVACLDVALSRLPNDRHTIVQDLDGPHFMTTQSLYSHVAPDGAALICTFKQLDPRENSDPHADERDLENLLDAVQTGWRDVLVKRQYLPRIDAIGSLPTAASGGYAGRPGIAVPGIDNLFLSGDWVGSGFLSDASLGSARDAAQAILNQQPALTAGAPEAA